MEQISLDWVLGYSDSPDIRPSHFFPASVPGAVQLDIAGHEGYPDYNFSDNYKMFRWMEDKFYTYRAVFPEPDLKPGESVFFVSKGIDYEFRIFLNGKQIHSQEGMFTYVDLELTGRLRKENILEVLVCPTPKKHPFPEDRTQASFVTKPAVSYGWDWHPRLIPLGIWDETYLQVRPASYLKDSYIPYELNSSMEKASISLIASFSCGDASTYRWKILDPDGNCLLQKAGPVVPELQMQEVIHDVRLWWTHDHGPQNLYTSELQVYGPDGTLRQEEIRNFGFRRVRLVMSEGAWEDSEAFPKSRNVAPVQIELNGRRIFAKGTNWVAPEIFPGLVGENQYGVLLDIARKTNFNILRTWGGCIVNKESFFELCDRKGLLVWQEFPLACNCYPDEEHYLQILEQEATSIIKRVRKHPCLGLWCGGNELLNSWSGMTDQSLPLRLLDSLCYKYDRSTPYNMTSPMQGMGHGHYTFCRDGLEIFELIHHSHKTAYSEFGMPSLSPVEVLKKIIPQEELNNPQQGGAWEEHHAFNAWRYEDGWFERSIYERYFGHTDVLSELVAQGNWLQAEGYKAIYEEARRQKPYCTMALNWCFNEPWPCAANNSLIAYPFICKPALEHVARACRPVCASARNYKFEWMEGEVFKADLWLLNDSYESFDSLRLDVYIISGDKSFKLLSWDTGKIEENTNVEGPSVNWKLPEGLDRKLTLEIRVKGRPESGSYYNLLYRPADRNPDGTPMMNVV